MIDPKGLRIGNFIFDDDGILAKVIGFHPLEHSVRCDEEEGCELLVDLYPQDGTVRTAMLVESKLASPIELTPDWLGNLGFNYKTPGIQGADMWQGLGYWSIGDLWFRGVFCRTRPVELKLAGYFNSRYTYVHEIQNIYNLITGKELTIKTT